MKKNKVVMTKGAEDAIKKMCGSKYDPTRAIKYVNWSMNFKPQSQRVINIVLITGLVLAMAEVVWFVVEKL